MARDANLRFVGVYGGKYRRIAGRSLWGKLGDISTLALNLRDLAAIAVGTLECIWQLARFRPQVIFNKVGPSGIPVGMAARLLGIHMVIHEPDVVPGLANRLLSGWAAKVAVGFPVEYYDQRFPVGKLVFTGTPVPDADGAGEPSATRQHLGFKANRALVLVTGGSQGATALNSAVIAILPQLLQSAQVYHLTGTRDNARVLKQTHGSSRGYRAEATIPIQDMKAAIAAATVVVARAGAGTIAELANLAKPVILVPNREAAAHQIANAAALEVAGAAVVVRDTESQSLLEALSHLISDRSEQRRLSEHITTFAHPDAAERLAALIQAVAMRGTAA